MPSFACSVQPCPAWHTSSSLFFIILKVPREMDPAEIRFILQELKQREARRFLGATAMWRTESERSSVNWCVPSGSHITILEKHMFINWEKTVAQMRCKKVSCPHPVLYGPTVRQSTTKNKNNERKLKSLYGARNRFQEPSLELSSQAT